MGGSSQVGRRLRVGRLWGMPYQEHPPERLQTADARLVSRSGWPGRPSSREIDAALFAPAERPTAAALGGKKSPRASASARGRHVVGACLVGACRARAAL